MRHELLQLMKEFKVCYEIPHHKGNYIAPHLLQKDPPNYDPNWDTNQNLILRYRYKIFMPKGILSRFIVEMHQKIENGSDPDRALVWKYGVVLNRGNTRAEVTERTHDREIRIRLSGSGQKEFLNIINHEFEKIHDRFENRLEYDTLIPCNCAKCKTLTEPYTYTLKRLNQYSEQRRSTIECYESGEDINVRRLLDDSIDPDRDWKLRDIGDDISSIEEMRSRSKDDLRERDWSSVQPQHPVTVNIYNSNQQSTVMTPPEKPQPENTPKSQEVQLPSVIAASISFGFLFSTTAFLVLTFAGILNITQLVIAMFSIILLMVIAVIFVLKASGNMEGQSFEKIILAVLKQATLYDAFLSKIGDIFHSPKK